MPFLDIIFPVFVTAAIGFVYDRMAKPDLQSIARLALYVLVPALVFNSLMRTEVTGREFGQIILYSLLLAGALTALVLVIIRIAGYDRERANALLLTSVFMNTANYGLPVVLFALGNAGFARAVIFVITQTFLVYSLGVYFAAAGRLDARRAITAIVKLPTFYAVALALVLRALHVTLPTAVLDPVQSLGLAAIPVMLLSLGMQLSRVRVVSALPEISLATVVRLVASPLVGLLLVRLLGMAPVTAKAMIIEAAMPTAVITALLSMEFGSAPAVVSSTVFVSTVLSFASIAVIVTWIM